MEKTKIITWFIIILIFASCGYHKPEEDKHPDLPLFPNHTNNKISIKQLPFVSSNIKYNEKNFFFYNGDGSITILDRKFNKIKKISEPTRYKEISKDGTLYFMNYNETPELIETYKMSVQNNFKKEKIPNLIIKSRSGGIIRDSLLLIFKGTSLEKDSIKFNKHIDSLTIIELNKQEEYISLKLEQLKENLIAVFPLQYSVSILKYENKEISLYTRYNHTSEFKEILEKTSFNGLKPIWNLEKSPKSFDKVVLGNSFSGNHFVGSFTSYGYNYVELTLNNEITKFKVKNIRNDNGVNIVYENNDTIILRDYNKLYCVTLKK